jgi:hypothetical protein
MYLAIYLATGLTAGALSIVPDSPQRAEQSSYVQAQPSPGRTGSRYVGSAMALLATLDQAGVLPPEGTPEANRIIKAVIQFQSAFLKSHQPVVRAFFTEAHRAKFGARAAEIEGAFQGSGWSAESFEAIMEAGQAPQAWAVDGLESALNEFNIGKPDFDLLAGLYQQSTKVFSERGQSLSEVYAARRRGMPGAQ